MSCRESARPTTELALHPSLRGRHAHRLAPAISGTASLAPELDRRRPPVGEEEARVRRRAALVVRLLHQADVRVRSRRAAEGRRAEHRARLGAGR
eukprot:904190-Prymnesium_polylepis.1